VTHLLYVGLLAACVLGTLPLEFVLHVRVYARWRRLVTALIPTIALFGGWDLAETAARAWSYDRRYLLGWAVLGRLPLEEVLFFVVVPTCAVLTLEAVRARRPHWVIGDEPRQDVLRS
jgi:lycopene cyclase domain-containing protein